MHDNPQQSIFKPIFAEHWQTLRACFKTRYAIRPYTNDSVVMKGTLNIETRNIMNGLRPFYRLLGNFPAVSEKNVPVTVKFESEPESDALHFNRTFEFTNRKHYQFNSTMRISGNNTIVEQMRFRVCWCGIFTYTNNMLEMKHAGFRFNFFGKLIPLPLTWLFGRGYGYEKVVDDDHFDMKITLTHPLFGQLFMYSGRFEVFAPEPAS